MTADRLPLRQRWDHRYASLSPQARQEPTPFVAACLPELPHHGWALDIALSGDSVWLLWAAESGDVWTFFASRVDH